MKRNLVAFALFVVLWLVTSATAQETPAALLAAREEMEANYKELKKKFELMEETLESQQKSTTTLLREIHSLREELDRLKTRNESAATQDSIRRLAEKIEEVDRKRQSDNELVLSQLKTLAKALSKPIKEPVVTPPPAASPDKPKTNGDAPPENVLAYKIKDGDTLSRIVTDLKAQGFKVTQKQIMDANPAVNWSRLRIGQTVYIPKPTP